MKHSLTARLLSVAALLVVIALSAGDAAAIPAFARKYQFSCSTCHAPVPRLKPFGEEFAARGLRLEDPSQEPIRATHDVGDPMLKLFRDLPLAARFDGWASYKENQPAEKDFEWPWSLKLLSGGPITDHISYYFYAIFEKGESVKLEDTFIQFTSVLDLPIDIMIGQFQVSDPMFKRELRLERNDYAIYGTRVGAIPTDLTYDRGVVFTWHAPAGIEAVLQVVNGNGIDEAVDESFDDNTLKNYAARLVRSFGPVRAGLFGYWGKTETVDGISSTRVRYLGPDLVIDMGSSFQLNLEYLERGDEDPFLVGRVGSDLKTRGGFAELHYFPQGQDGRWVISALYNKVDSDLPESQAENASLTLTRLAARNFKLLGEVHRDLDRDTTRISVGFMTAF